MKKLLIMVLVFAVMLCGCSTIKESEIDLNNVSSELSELSYSMENDRTVAVTLYFLNETTGRLSSEIRELSITAEEVKPEEVISLLFGGPINEKLKDVNCGTEFEYAEITDNICNVYLTANIVPQGYQSYLLCSAIANTFADTYGTEYCVVFINGIAQSAGGTIAKPFKKNNGVILQSYEIEQEEYMQMQQNPGKAVESEAVIYFLDSSGKYILPEVRTIRYTKDTYLSVLMDEMASNSKNKGYIVPSVNSSASSYTQKTYENENLSINCSKYPFIYKNENLNSENICIAALTYTFTGAVAAKNMNLKIADNAYINISRDKYREYLGANITIMFPDKNYTMLFKTYRTVAQKDLFKADAKLRELVKGPTKADNENTWPAFPKGITEEDILGVYINEDMVVLNVSENFVSVVSGVDENMERTMVFAIVNTLVEDEDTRQVLFLSQGNRIDYMAGYIYYGDPIMANTGLVR